MTLPVSEESMKKIDDGGPAFPQQHYFKDGSPRVPEGDQRGASLRDLFAGFALAGLLTSQACNGQTVKDAWDCADAMIRARAPSQDGGNHE